MKTTDYGSVMGANDDQWHGHEDYYEAVNLFGTSYHRLCVIVVSMGRAKRKIVRFTISYDMHKFLLSSLLAMTVSEFLFWWARSQRPCSILRLMCE